ncbi:hypothetical protein HDU87_007779 [Geranomyces variabilis]|uniref:Polynucleotide 5'-hydroxyl-kinase GRC3 n=1 Tax=Geranomyces variabilis TaxID=109894 RepID=A0AAD5XMI6_9FUNG|nr:hypothetical protein HDU87_007779 [Geranomyces variabilis]
MSPNTPPSQKFSQKRSSQSASGDPSSLYSNNPFAALRSLKKPRRPEEPTAAESPPIPKLYTDSLTLDDPPPRPPPRAGPVISTFKPSHDNVATDGTLCLIALAPGESIPVFSAIEGFSTTDNAGFSQSRGRTASAETITAIKHLLSTLKTDTTVICLRAANAADRGLLEIARTVPSLRFAFRNRDETANFTRIPGLYPIIAGSADISPLILPLEWERAVDKLCSATAAERKVLCTVGSKNMGKSTFGRYLVNRLLNIYPKAAFLECDVGQSEFTPSGMMSLHVISAPILGPPFSHLLTPYRSVYIGATSPKCDPDCYLAGLRHLYGVFERDFLQANDFVPLVINTHGWIRGMGLDLLVHFLHSVQPTHIFQLAVPPGTPASGARNVMVDLPAVLSGMPGPPFSCVLSEIPADDSYRPNPLNGSDLRIISLVSYFHQLPPTPSVDRPAWSFTTPIAARTPYIVPFDSVRIKFLHSEVPFGETLHALNGCIVGLIIDETAYEKPSLENGGDENELPHVGKNLRIIPTELPFLPQNHTSVGIGLIRAIDMEAGTFHVLAGPTPPELLRQVNTFVRGAGFETPIPLLASGFENPRMTRPYTTTSSSEGIGSLAWRARHNLNRRRPGDRNP